MTQQTYADAIAKIEADREKMSASEGRVADYILSERDIVTTMSAREIARASGVSAATVSRFARSLGYGSFADLRLALVRSLVSAEGSGVGQDDASDGAVGPSDDVTSLMMRDSLNRMSKELWSTVKYLGACKLHEAADAIRNANMVVVAGVGNTLPMAQSASFLLSQIGVRAVTPSTPDGASLLALSLREGDCLLLLSNSGRSKRLQLTLDNAVDTGATVITVTQDPTAPLARNADIVLRIDSHYFVFNGQSVRFQMPMYFAVMTLFLLVASGIDTAKDKAYIAQRAWTLDQGRERPTYDDLIG